MYNKNTYSKFFTKDLGHKIIGGMKGAARFLDEPIVQAGISAAFPEVASAYAMAKSSGILQKIKN